ncbi:Bidirectional sugar transporter SWEET [Rhynchospora pubera]|uniref:Bidirectional sugar transporter SWEET n=1 Tax=Rhynchospora pubera TaxID=906938 RepID=A0AAV8EMN0_9POAL|nr:Bidirectional sugar transporter SWEET [Rhynchospora pubera]
MVSPDTVRTLIGVVGNTISIILVLSPMPTFYRIWKNKSVEQFSPIPYIATAIGCTVWVLYGLPIVHPHSILIITTSGPGLVIELFYVILFILYSQGKKRLQVFTTLVASIVVLGVLAVLIIMLVHTHEHRSMILGILGGMLNIISYGSPLSVMKMVIQTKSVEYMPFYLSMAIFFNTVCWTAYGLIIFDPYITIPNGVGVIFATAQLLLHAIYYKSTQR